MDAETLSEILEPIRTIKKATIVIQEKNELVNRRRGKSQLSTQPGNNFGTVMMQSIYNNPSEYDLKFSNYQTDYQLILEWAEKANGKIIDLGCGTGRLTIPLFEKGYNVEGVDLSPSMLSRAKEKANTLGLNIAFHEMDLTNLSLYEKAAMMFMVGNTFQHILSNHEQDKMLSSIHNHLKDDGILIFGTRMPVLEELAEQQNYEETFLTENNELILEGHTEEYDTLTQILTCITNKYLVEGNEEKWLNEEQIQIRYSFPQEINRLVACNNFEILHTYGAWGKEEMKSESKEIIMILRKMIQG